MRDRGTQDPVILKHGLSTDNEKKLDVDLTAQLESMKIPQDEVLSNLGLFMKRQTLSRLLFMDHIYKEMLPVHGSVFEFGVRWGQNLAYFLNFRGIYEPYNYNRKVVGFDTFEGFPDVAKEDGKLWKEGAYNVSKDWEINLNDILASHESNAPISHIRKFELVKGDACVTVPKYLSEHPETIVSLAYFDFDLYKPTKTCLETLLPHLTKGSILAFDELNTPAFPGETVALREILGLGNYKIQRVPYNPLTSYLIIE